MVRRVTVRIALVVVVDDIAWRCRVILGTVFFCRHDVFSDIGGIKKPQVTPGVKQI
jgi:hypothetical protein